MKQNSVHSAPQTPISFLEVEYNLSSSSLKIGNIKTFIYLHIAPSTQNSDYTSSIKNRLESFQSIGPGIGKNNSEWELEVVQVNFLAMLIRFLIQPRLKIIAINSKYTFLFKTLYTVKVTIIQFHTKFPNNCKYIDVIWIVRNVFWIY